MSDQNKKTTHYGCKLCPQKKAYSYMKTVGQHLVESHSGFAFYCTGCNKLNSRKLSHRHCNGAPIHWVKKTSLRFGEKEKKEFSEFKKNIRNHVEIMSGQTCIAQKAKENRTKPSTKTKRKVDEKSRRPLVDMTGRNITPRASSPILKAKRPKTDHPQINTTSCTETTIEDDVLSLDAPSDDSMFADEDEEPSNTIEEPVEYHSTRNFLPIASSPVLKAKRPKTDHPQINTASYIEATTEVDVLPLDAPSDDCMFDGGEQPLDTSIMDLKLKKIQECQESPIHLIVGGIKFVTSIPTITTELSVLSAMVVKDSIVKPQLIDNIPTYSLDRNPTEFSVILDYLQNKDNGTAKDYLPHTTRQLDHLLLEASFYELEGLKALIVGKLDDTTWQE